MRISCVLLLLGVICGSAFAGPNEGGTLLLHANTSLAYSLDEQGYCGQSGLASCDSAVVSVTGTGTYVFFAVASFPAESSPRLAGITFGIQFDPDELVLVDGGGCGDFELPDGDWPAAGSGTSVTWSSAETALLTEVYWFAAYAPYGGPTTFELAPNPGQGAFFADDTVPSELDSIADLGTLGFGMSGTTACPSGGEEDGPMGGDGGEFPEGAEDGPLAGRQPSRPSTDTEPFHRVDLFDDLIDYDGCVSSGSILLGGGNYPSFLDDDALIVLRDYADTVGVVASWANGGHNFYRHDDYCPSTYVELQIDPPQSGTCQR